MSDSPDDLGADLRSAVARLYSRFRSERSDGELGDAALAVLMVLHKTGPRTLTELSERALVTPGSMSQTVNRLVAGGFVRRLKDPHDGRRVLIEPIPDGSAIAMVARAHRQGWLNARLAELTEPERATLARAAELMHRIAGS